MNNINLRPEAGGDPARSHSNDLKNDPKVSQDGNDFPDAPDTTSDERPQDKPDLAAFAKRMGTDTIETSDDADAAPDDRSPTSDTTKSKVIIAGGGAAVATLLFVGVRRRKKHNLLSKAVAVGAVANVIRS